MKMKTLMKIKGERCAALQKVRRIFRPADLDPKGFAKHLSGLLHS